MGNLDVYSYVCGDKKCLTEFGHVPDVFLATEPGILS